MVSERLGKYINYKGISYYAFENSLGTSRGGISKAVKDGGNIGSNVLENILISYPDLSAEWLLTGAGNMLKKETTSIISDIQSKGEKQPHYDELQYGTPRPFIDSMYATCGAPNGFNLAIQAFDCENIIIPFLSNYDFSIRARGDSMINRTNPQRTICERDIIACKLWTSRSHIRWGEVYALSTTEGVVIKKIMKSEQEGYIKCVSFNIEDGFTPYDLPIEEIYDWAIVVGVVSVNTW